MESSPAGHWACVPRIGTRILNHDHKGRPSWYVLDSRVFFFFIALLYQVSLLLISFQSVTCLFIIWIVFFFSRTGFNFNEVTSLSILSFMDCAFGFVYQKSSPNQRSSSFPPVLYGISFVVLHFILKSDPLSINFYERCKFCV